MAALITGYKIDRKIKDGGFCAVYEATRLADKKKLAIKMLREEGVRAGFTKDFKNEAKIMAALPPHKHVIDVYDYLESAARPAYTMEFFPSENLKLVILRHAESIREASVGVFIGVARALAHLHENGVVHRDVKPENILIDDSGDVRLIDFSLAFRNTFMGRIARSKKVQGTPLYMAPEQIRNKGIDHRCDVYALGCVFYEVLSGKPPFMAKTQTQLLSAHMKTKPAQSTQFSRNIPNKLQNLVLSMMKKKPDNRPEMPQVVDDLLHIARVWENVG